MVTAGLGRTGGVRGILAGVGRLEGLLHVAFVLLTAASAVRYVDRHGLGEQAPWVLAGAAVLLAVYAAHPRARAARAPPGRPRGA